MGEPIIHHGNRRTCSNFPPSLCSLLAMTHVFRDKAPNLNQAHQSPNPRVFSMGTEGESGLFCARKPSMSNTGAVAGLSPAMRRGQASQRRKPTWERRLWTQEGGQFLEVGGRLGQKFPCMFTIAGVRIIS